VERGKLRLEGKPNLTLSLRIDAGEKIEEHDYEVGIPALPKGDLT
jgi:hypothetical protein